jgi:DNA-binding transcriptional LysR family regulator
LQALLLPALARFMPAYPALTLELSTSNDFANLTRRDADIALRLTRTPPEHLVGRHLGNVVYRICVSTARSINPNDLASMSWIAPDDFLPDHPTVAWRRQHLPGVVPAYRCNSMLSVTELVRAGLGVAALPDFLINEKQGLMPIGEPLAGYDTALWLLTRPDCRALRSVVTLFDELGRHLRLR